MHPALLPMISSLFSTVSIMKTWRLELIFGFLAGSTQKHVLEKNCLDTHFSFVNIQLQSFVLSGNDITTEHQMFEALGHKNGLLGLVAVILDGSQPAGTVL
jgi:hypothetical protein